MDPPQRRKVCLAIASALFIGAPAAFNTWWYFFSSTPPYQWFYEKGFPVLNFSALWITGPIGIGILAAILFSLRGSSSEPVATPKRRRRSADRKPSTEPPVVFPKKPIILDLDLPPLTPTKLFSFEEEPDSEKQARLHREWEQEQERLGISVTLPRESEKKKRSEVRDKLSAFLIVGDKLKRRCANPADDVSKAEVDKWYSMVATYIRENVSYADKNRFISDTNIPPFPRIERRDGERELLWQILNRRAYQLAKILDELKPL